MQRRTVGILVFEGVEVLDFAGPYEVFSRTRLVPGLASRRSDESAPFRPLLIGPSTDVVVATGGLKVVPDHGLDEAPHLDLLLVPGGFGSRALLEDSRTLTWILERSAVAELTTSVCSGALVLAKLGLLSGRRATTHHGSFDTLAQIDPSIVVRRDERVVEDGIITSAGVAAGIDMSFRVVELLCGVEVADETAAYIEYPRP
ncbi:DJ-1/PfpI family protein [Engelhardtia mirabilis]|uniref:Isonitrile hydratase n=1 Tax=Engelhardtia mirabilis TaxID=2528011 RepID=A0A518BED0_9BACT|nr:Isonitrile hydratase [Planctomycetes bacterium Pla133]QDU99665.1 Isonitrile hydratase [Planctomycetes bacterium Pla86]